MIHTVCADDIAPQAWRNGGGRTRELLAWPSAAQWDLRISLADIDADGPFSAFPGIERWFSVVEGAGVVLQFPDRVLHVTPSDSPLRFDGADAPDCRLLNGPTRDLNLMARHGDGFMFSAEAGVPWAGDATQRGLFCTVAGTWHNSEGRHVDLPARSLLWVVTPGRTSFSFSPRATHAGQVGWWLGHTPSGEG
jgi:environmental stress-induced protein Ves